MACPWSCSTPCPWSVRTSWRRGYPGPASHPRHSGSDRLTERRVPLRSSPRAAKTWWWRFWPEYHRCRCRCSRSSRVQRTESSKTFFERATEVSKTPSTKSRSMPTETWPSSSTRPSGASFSRLQPASSCCPTAPLVGPPGRCCSKISRARQRNAFRHRPPAAFWRLDLSGAASKFAGRQLAPFSPSVIGSPMAMPAGGWKSSTM